MKWEVFLCLLLSATTVRCAIWGPALKDSPDGSPSVLEVDPDEVRSSENLKR